MIEGALLTLLKSGWVVVFSPLAASRVQVSVRDASGNAVASRQVHRTELSRALSDVWRQVESELEEGGE